MAKKVCNLAGPEDKKIYSGKISDNIYLPEGGAAQSIDHAEKVPGPKNKEEKITEGQRIFLANCVACHQAQGQGVPQAFPPLAGSDFLNQDKMRAVDVVLNGLSGKVVVNGQSFDSVMPALGLSDDDIANVLTFVLNSWNNPGGEISPADVAKRRMNKK